MSGCPCGQQRLELTCVYVSRYALSDADATWDEGFTRLILRCPSCDEKLREVRLEADRRRWSDDQDAIWGVWGDWFGTQG